MSKPKNRVETPLPILQILVDHADGTEQVCPNGMVTSVIWTRMGEDPKITGIHLAQGSKPFDILSIKPIDGVQSIISGEPAVIYRSDDIEIPMSTEELLRFAAHDLRPEEFLKLRETYGDFFEIHDDFYDPDTGEAFQPMEFGYPD